MNKRCGYEEVLALEFFKHEIANYDDNHAAPDLFAPIVRNLGDESVIFDIRDELIPGPDEDSDEEERREYARWRRQCEDDSATETCACLWGCPHARETLRTRLISMPRICLCPCEYRRQRTRSARA